MKRFACMILVLCMALSLAACGGGKTAAPESTKAPAAAAEKTKMTPEEVAAALDKAESAAELKKLIDALEGTYGETEKIELDGESITLAEIREMYDLFKSIESGGGDEPTGEPVTGDALKAVGEWTGVYCKFVGDENGVTDEPFSLVLKEDGTGVHARDGMEFNVTWTLSGEDFAMSETFIGDPIEYTGTLSGGVLRLFNGDPTSDLTYEYVYGQGDVSGIEIPRGEEPAPEIPAGLDAFRGDWNGALLFTNCTGKYEYLDDGVPLAAIARFAVRDDGTIEPFIGINVEDTPFTNLTARYSDFWEELTISGSWINAPFEDVAVKERNGTLSITVPVSKEAGSLEMVMNFRRLNDRGWTDEVPNLGAGNIEYCMGKSFDELAALIGYDSGDYPAEDPNAPTVSPSEPAPAGETPAGLDPADKEGADGKMELETLKELLPKCKSGELSYSTTYEEVAAIFGCHGRQEKSLFEGKSVYRWWATDTDYIQITFDQNEDGSETWNVTQWSGLK